MLIASTALPVLAGQKHVTDQWGREMMVPDNPQKVVSLAPSITEIIYALGQETRIAGATVYSNFPEAARALPRVGSYVKLDIERIAALSPDLCIAIKEGNPIAAVRRIESLGTSVFAVNPTDLWTMLDAVDQIGMLLNAEDKARETIVRLESRINAVRQAVQKAGTKPRLFFQIGISPIVGAGSSTFLHNLIEQAGGKNTSAGPTAYPRYSREQVIHLDPEVIIISTMARDTAFDQVKAEWEKWPAITAVRSGRIHIVNSDIFNRASPRLVDGLEILARLLHPELFP